MHLFHNMQRATDYYYEDILSGTSMMLLLCKYIWMFWVFHFLLIRPRNWWSSEREL